MNVQISKLRMLVKVISIIKDAFGMINQNYVFQIFVKDFVEMESLRILLKHVMMVIIFHMMDVINVKSNVHQVVYNVKVNYVMYVIHMDGIQLMVNVNQYVVMALFKAKNIVMMVILQNLMVVIIVSIHVIVIV